MTTPDDASARLLLAGLEKLGLDAGAAPALLAYLAELRKWNRAYNLSGVRNEAEMVTRHLLDSLAVLPALADAGLAVSGQRLIDVGSGAGLPGLVLAIAAPRLQVTVLDSSGKKARFMRHAQRTLALSNAEVVEARAEDHAPGAPYDYVISRAFAALGDFLHATAPLGAANGKWLAMKGKLDRDEQDDLPEGFEIVDVKPLTVPGLNEARHLVIAARAP